MARVAIFIDGGYLTKVLQESFDSPKIDFARFSKRLAAGDRILRTYYYTCLPYRSTPPTPEETERYINVQRFVNALRHLDRYEVREGKLAKRGIRPDGKPDLQQKGVDILLACDLILLSAKQRIDKAILITGDGDFIPAIEIAKNNEGVEIELVYDTGPHVNRGLIEIADVRRPLTQADIDAVKIDPAKEPE